MMTDFEKLGKQLAESGKAGAIQEIAESDDGRKLLEKLDAGKVEAAAKSGDAEALRNILREVLSTGEGRRMAEKLREAMGK